MKTFSNYFLFDIMAKKGSPLIFISNIPPPVRRNLVIEYFTVNLAHWFVLMDFLPHFWSRFSVMVFFTKGLIFQSSLNVKTFSAECYLGTGHISGRLLDCWRLTFCFYLKVQVAAAAE